MATVKAFIRTSKLAKTKSVFVRFRLSDGRTGSGGVQIFHTSNISILPSQWDEKQQKIKARCLIDEQHRILIDKSISERKKIIQEIYLKKGKELTSEQLESEIDKFLNPEKYIKVKKSFFEIYDEFLLKHPISEVRGKNYLVVKRTLQRFELYTKLYVKGQKQFSLEVNTLNADILHSFDKFLRTEHENFKTHPELYIHFPEKKASEPRGSNTVSGIFTKLRTFINWCNRNDITSNNPFTNFTPPKELYGTPYYLTKEEKKQLFNFDFSMNKSLEKQRDIFIFQCSVGCRAGDLLSLKKDNLINEAIEYVASKTKDEKPKTLRVPLNIMASKIVAKYANTEGDKLLPFISQQKYNNSIKEVFTIAGINRKVTILNPLTRKSEIHPLNEIASSHLARRTFCGLLYKEVKDPNVVGSMSGHAEGSKAFARYRDIDEDMKKEVVSLLD